MSVIELKNTNLETGLKRSFIRDIPHAFLGWSEGKIAKLCYDFSRLFKMLWCLLDQCPTITFIQAYF
jgi:hypothetical protein